MQHYESDTSWGARLSSGEVVKRRIVSRSTLFASDADIAMTKLCVAHGPEMHVEGQ